MSSRRLLCAEEALTELVCASVPCLEKRLYEATDFASLSPAIEKTDSITITLAIPFMLPIDPLF